MDNYDYNIFRLLYLVKNLSITGWAGCRSPAIEIKRGGAPPRFVFNIGGKANKKNTGDLL